MASGARRKMNLPIHAIAGETAPASGNESQQKVAGFVSQRTEVVEKRFFVAFCNSFRG